MTEHVHVCGPWTTKMQYFNGFKQIRCQHCGEPMLLTEILSRLNATDELSALQAKELIVFAMGSTRISQPELADALQAYADIREGKPR